MEQGTDGDDARRAAWGQAVRVDEARAAQQES